MRHPSIRELFHYWSERRGARSAPERNEIEPFAIRSALADAFLLTFDRVKGHPFRLAGTRICALFRREVKGVPFLDLFAQNARDEIEDLIAIITQEAVGLIASASESRPIEHASPFELILLPLALDGRTDACLLGALAPRDSDWLSTRGLRDLALGKFRFLAAATARPYIAESVPEGRIRHGLVVYDGGQCR